VQLIYEPIEAAHYVEAYRQSGSLYEFEFHVFLHVVQGVAEGTGEFLDVWQEFVALFLLYQVYRGGDGLFVTRWELLGEEVGGEGVTSVA